MLKSESPQQWAEQYCAARGFNWEFAQNNDVQLVGDAEARRAGYAAKGGIIFHANDPITKQRVGSSQIRHQHPPTYDGKLRKFSTVKRADPAPYFAPCMDWQRVFKNTKIDLVISEGPTRALAGAKHGLYVIALTGVDCHGVGDELHSSLRRISWKGRRVFIAYDADAASNGHVQKAEHRLAAKLVALGATVHIVRVPRLTADGKTGLDDLLAMQGGPGMFAALCDAAQPHSAVNGKDRTPHITSLSDVTARSVPWLWKPYLAFAMLAMLSGDPDAGKTFIALAIAAALSNGRIPFSGEKCEPIATLYMSVENAAEFVTKPRFVALGGNTDRFHILDYSIGSDGTQTAVTMQDVNLIEAAVVEKKAKLLIIDPLQSYLGANVDSHRSNETRPVMDGLIRLAERQGVCVLIVRHLAKSSGGRAIHRGLGSIDLTGAVRTEMLAGTAPDDPNVRALVQIKNNVGPRGQSLCYEIAGKDGSAKLVWKGTSDLTSADLLAPEASKKSKTKIERAGDYLRAELADGPRLVSELEGGEYSQRELQKAAAQMGIRRGRKGVRGPVEWSLPSAKLAKEGRNDN